MSSADNDHDGPRPAPTFTCGDEQENESNNVCTVVTDYFLEGVVARFYGAADPLFEEVRRLRALRTRNEDARKRVLSAALVTTQNAARIQSLRALVVRETKELRPLLEELMQRLAVLDIARQQLEVYEAAEEQIRGERNERDHRQLTPLTYEFVDFLYKHYGIDGSALSCLEGEDYDAIDEIVKKRHAMVVPELYL